ncbi:MAG: hypothetical protein SF123_10550, partial [Chloroflexota bacterium]|nr:hypothetical protein [Chloroflexota bacterium]
MVVIVGAWAGTTWDRIWHATVPFDGFWSPPHIVVYVTVASVSFIIMGLVFSAPLRRAFGRGFDVIILPFKVPGSLFILSGGLVLLSLAGAVFDNLWHTAFGLNETGWSFPHAMIGTSLMVVAFGFVSCRLAMQPVKPMPWFTTLLLASLTATMIFNIVLGPIGGNRTPESVSFFFSYIPALASQDSSQAVYRIYDTWNLNRTHPALLLLAPLALGIVLGWVRQLDARWWMTLLIMALIYLLDSGNRDFGDLIAQYVPEFARDANWRALPVMIPTLAVLILPRLRMGERLSYALAGILFALLIFNIWGAE